MEVLSFKPLYYQRPWGGDALKRLLNRELPSGPVGESWEIVDRPEAQSVIIGGAFAGKTLREVMQTHAAEIMGPRWPFKKPFPLIIKWLDCSGRLSLQVHPPVNKALSLSGEPKTEFWYVLNSEKNAGVFLGLKPHVSRFDFEYALSNNTLESLLHWIPTYADQGIFVPSGRLHAIDAGNMILEIQQNSDTTYRVYDWGRLGLDGKPRQLHRSESLECINFEDIQPKGIRVPSSAGGVWVDCPYFKIFNFELKKKGNPLILKDGPYVISVVRGLIKLKSSDRVYSLGEHILVPYAMVCEVEGIEDAHLIVTAQFNFF